MAHSGVNGFGTSVRPPAREITQVKVRKPTVRDLKALEPVKGAAARTAKMIELLTGLNVQEVAAIHRAAVLSRVSQHLSRVPVVSRDVLS